MESGRRPYYNGDETDIMKKFAGDKTVFAIEYELYLVKPTNYFGDFWFWVNGDKIGAEESDTYL